MFESRLILDRYRIIGRAGAGGYATVQHAYDTRLKRDVAIKCIELTQRDIDRARISAADGQFDRRSILDEVLAEEAYDPNDGAPLPSEPGFLSMRDAIAQRRAGTRGFSRASRGLRGKSDRGIYSRYNRASRYSTRIPDNVVNQQILSHSNRRGSSPQEFSTNTADITSLAGALPAINGAGFADIASIDDAVDVSEVYAENHAYSDDGETSGGFRADRLNADDSFDELGNPAHTIPLIGTARKRARLEHERKSTNTMAFPKFQADVVDDGFLDDDLLAKEQAGARIADKGKGRISDEDLQKLQAAMPALENSLDNIPGLEEARTAANLNDANIVTVYDCVVEGNMAYVIMEYVEGKTLARLMRELDNNITLDMVTSVFTSVTHALQVAHKAGVLHLDIKPENVIINRDGIVKVADFGLSTLMDTSGHGTTGGGTIGYMPLEQMRQLPLDVRSDEWALASLTYEMLTGANPFRAKTLEGAEVAILDAVIEPPSHFWDIDPEIDHIMVKALAPNIDERYGNVNEFSKNLTKYLGNSKSGQKQLATIVINGVEDPEDAYGNEGGKPGFFSLFSERKVYDASDDEPDDNSNGPRSAERVREQIPLIDRIGKRGRSIIMRVFAALAAAMIGAISLLNYRFEFAFGANGGAGNNAANDTATGDGNGASPDASTPGVSGDPGAMDPTANLDPGAVTEVGTPDIGETASNIASNLNDSFTSAYSTTYGDESLFGLFSLAPVVAWVLLAAFVVCALIKPKIGLPVTYFALFVMLLLNQAWGSAFLLLAATGAYWWFFGRHSDEACTVVMLQPLFGSVGFAALSPVLAGALLDLKDAAAASVMASIGAIVFASLGSANVMNWEVYSNFIVAVNPVIAGASIMQGLGETFGSLSTWTIIASWILGACLYSLFCWKGTRSFDILGSIVCGALVVLGAFFVPVVIVQAEPMSPLAILGVILPALIGIIFAVMRIPDRVRIEESS